jgi:hypothetical protein
MPGQRCWMPRPGNWRNGACEGSALNPAVIVTPGAAAAGAARFEGITAAIAAIFPAAGTGATLTATPITTTALAVTTPIAVAAATVVTTTTTAVAAAATTPAGSTATGLSLVDAQGTAHQLGALQTIDGPVFHLGIRHLHEGESALAAGVTLQRKGAVHHVAERRKKLCHVLLLSSEGQIANKNTHEPGRPPGRSMRAPGPQTGKA